MNILTTVTKVTFDINGLSISYQKSSSLRFEQNTLTLCPVATCKALKLARMIEGFELDNNNEPVILFTSPDTAAGYSGQHWCDFAKSFRMTNRYAEMLIEARDEKKSFQKQYNIINKLWLLSAQHNRRGSGPAPFLFPSPIKILLWPTYPPKELQRSEKS